MEVDFHKTSQLIANGVLTINDGYRAKNSELSSEGKPFARAGNINNGFQFREADRFPVEDLHKVGIKISKPGDVVFTSKGTVGRFAFVREGTEQFVYSPQLCFWRSENKEILNSRWLYYWMHSFGFLSQVGAVKDKTDMAAYVSLTDQRSMSMPLPSIETQKAIAHILGTLDDKIDLNRRMNETLEAMGRAIFKSWFIDFDDCMEFEESEFGPIPKGWRASTVGQEVGIVGGATPSTKNTQFWDDGTYHWATPKDLSGLSSPVLLDTARKITKAGVNKISSGILPAGTLLMSSRAPIGYLAINEVPTAINQGFIAMKCEKELSSLFMLFWCKRNMDIIKSNSNGSTFMEISKQNFRPIPIIVPGQDLLIKFNDVVGALYGKIVANLHQINTLEKLRDTLLPKLLSGKLQIPEIEKIMSEI